MKKQRPLVPYERPMALRRTFFAVVVVLGALFLVRELTSTSSDARAQLSAQRLATSMGNALLHVRQMTISVASQSGESAGGTMSVEHDGDYQYAGQIALDPLLTGEVRDVGGTFYFRFSRAAIYQILTTSPLPLAANPAQADAAAVANRWFTTTNGLPTPSGAPAMPTNVHDLFSSLGITHWTRFHKQRPTSNQGVNVIPLQTGDVTWFVPLSGNPLPNAASLYLSTVQQVLLPILAGVPTVDISFQRVTIATPTNLAPVSPAFASLWNQLSSQQELVDMSPYALLWMAFSPHR